MDSTFGHLIIYSSHFDFVWTLSKNHHLAIFNCPPFFVCLLCCQVINVLMLSFFPVQALRHPSKKHCHHFFFFLKRESLCPKFSLMHWFWTEKAGCYLHPHSSRSIIHLHIESHFLEDSIKFIEWFIDKKYWTLTWLVIPMEVLILRVESNLFNKSTSWILSLGHISLLLSRLVVARKIKDKLAIITSNK